MKLWDKGTKINSSIENFTIGKDKQLDLTLARHDVLGSIAHCMMLESIGLLTPQELIDIKRELILIYKISQIGMLLIDDGVEDIHSQIEIMLTKKLGDVGKKIHNGRSRNDQVLLDLKLFVREEINTIANLTNDLFKIFIEKSETFKNILMPGYTHLQVAMPSSFGLWFGAYAESLTDDMQLMLAAYKITNQNPLGSAAGYGSSFPLNRQLTTELLGFENMNYNVVYAQMGRGKLEKTVAFAMASIAATIAKFAADAALYMSQNFNFIALPDEFTTGSSIMPHKKNPDVFELLRGRCNKLQALPNEILVITNNLTSGYFRDLQTIKESFIPAFESLKESIVVLKLVLSTIKVRENIIDDEKYKYMFSVEELNKKVLSGKAFRDAYKEMGEEIAQGKFKPEMNVKHTHEGSIGNLMNKEIIKKMDSILYEFNFEKAEAAISKLLKI